MDKKYIFNNSLNIYEYGSVVYGCNSINSDKDYIVISDIIGDAQISVGNEDFNIYSTKTFQEKLNNNDISALECMFLDKKHILKETIKFDFEINKENLKESLGKLSSNSYAKCHKKLTVEKDLNPYVAKKSLWHAFRIIMFGIQILETGKINDYTCANVLRDRILEMPDNWDNIKFVFKPEFNELKTKWRLAFKEENIEHPDLSSSNLDEETEIR